MCFDSLNIEIAAEAAQVFDDPVDLFRSQRVSEGGHDL
jgi:hypothetical protein